MLVRVHHAIEYLPLAVDLWQSGSGDATRKLFLRQSRGNGIVRAGHSAVKRTGRVRIIRDCCLLPIIPLPASAGENGTLPKRKPR